jgi:hypothetical protein
VASIACAEFPELASLTDDTSNDFTVVSVLSVHTMAPIAPHPLRATVLLPRRTLHQKWSESPQRTCVSGNPHDLLELYSTLKT